MAGAKDDSRTIFGWCMYDWANSAYTTTIVAALLPAYFEKSIVPEGGITWLGRNFSAVSLWAYGVSISAMLAFFLSPVLGAIADFSSAKKRFLLLFAYVGSMAATLLYFSGPGDVISTLVLFVFAQFGFVSANVFYDAFLPQLVSEEHLDRISGRGYAFGYLGGGVQFALALGLYAAHERLGLSEQLAVRIGLASAGLWWAGFSLFLVFFVREAPSKQPLPPRLARYPKAVAYAAVGVTRTLATVSRVRRYKHLVLFLAAFMFYNEGIQTVISMATIYGSGELKLSIDTLMYTLLIIQGVAMIGSLAFGRLAERIGTKRTILITLGLWSAVVIYAYFIHTKAEFFILGMIVGLVLGGSQALSRSYYGSMIPEGASAEFYGFYTVFSKFSAILGPLAFGLIRQYTGSARNSIVSLIGFFLLGMGLLFFVNEGQARLARTDNPAVPA